MPQQQTKYAASLKVKMTMKSEGKQGPESWEQGLIS